jgi:hypothetical protein
VTKKPKPLVVPVHLPPAAPIEVPKPDEPEKRAA